MSFIPAATPEPPPEPRDNMERWARAGILVAFTLALTLSFVVLTVGLGLRFGNSELAAKYGDKLIELMPIIGAFVLGRVTR